MKTKGALMTAWFLALTMIQRFFALCALFGGLLFGLRTVLMFLGMDEEGDGALSDSDSSFQFLSLQGLTAFFMMFGLVALALSTQNGVGNTWAVAGGVIAGVGTAWLIGKLLSGMKRLQSDGTLRIERAIDKVGEVYLTIPPEGSGQVRIEVQGQLRIFDAVTAGTEPLKTGSRVRVSRIAGGSTLEVEPCS
jgi:membrane protein implicated in regulation of membrane protease activity